MFPKQENIAKMKLPWNITKYKMPPKSKAIRIAYTVDTVHTIFLKTREHNSYNLRTRDPDLPIL